jgi:hypothetical protein
MSSLARHSLAVVVLSSVVPVGSGARSRVHAYLVEVVDHVVSTKCTLLVVITQFSLTHLNRYKDVEATIIPLLNTYTNITAPSTKPFPDGKQADILLSGITTIDSPAPATGQLGPGTSIISIVSSSSSSDERGRADERALCGRSRRGHDDDEC